jgi:uncharacterized cupin superfamily protein
MKPILNIADAQEIGHLTHSDIFEMRMCALSDPIGGKAIGANVTTVPPGKAAFPFHHHYANEEHFYILRGSGTLRAGTDTHTVKVGDYIVNPAGGPEHAHQLINTGSEDLVYLALSTRINPEVVGYPDSGKTGVATVHRGAPGPARFLVADADREKIDYWDSEDGAQVRAQLKTK